MRRTAIAVWPALAAALAAAPAGAGTADVVAVRATCEQRVCVFAVTVRHADAGWDHYADRFEILTPEGEILGTRVLAHPHVREQPFTRLLPGVRIPEGVSRVRVRAHDRVHGDGGAALELGLAADGEFRAGAPPGSP